MLAFAILSVTLTLAGIFVSPWLTAMGCALVAVLSFFAAVRVIDSTKRALRSQIESCKTTIVENTSRLEGLDAKLSSRETELANANAHSTRLYEEVNQRGAQISKLKAEVASVAEALQEERRKYLREIESPEAHRRIFLARCERVVRLARKAIERGGERERREWPECVKDLLECSVAASVCESFKANFLWNFSQAYPHQLDKNWHAPTEIAVSALQEGISLVTRLRDQVKDTDVEPWPWAPQGFYLDEGGYLTAREAREMYE